MSWVLFLPIAVPMITAIIVLFCAPAPKIRRLISLTGSASLLLAAVVLFLEVQLHDIIAAQMGNWPAPFGITLVADPLSAVMVLITAIVGLAVGIYAVAEADPLMEMHGFHTLYHVLLAGVCGAFLTGDLFNLYVWFEVMLIASFGLLVLGGSKEQMDGGIKYVGLNLISTLLFLTGIGLLYGMTGTLNMADLHLAAATTDNQALMTVIAMMFMVAFGIKAAVFPLFFWLPASYHTPSVAVSAVFAGLLTKVGVYAMIRVFTLIFTHDVGFTHTILLIVAGLTMVTGVLGAAAQDQVRKILSFHIVSQIGYMVMGLALFTPLGLIGAVFYLVHHIIVKANLFLVGGVMNRLAGSFELKRIGGLYAAAPLLAVLFLIPALSLAGIPPLSGFWAKFVLVKASLDIGFYIIAGTALVVGLLTIYSMSKIWAEGFWKPHPDGEAAVTPISRAGLGLFLLPIASLAGMTIIIGLFPEPFFAFAERSAALLLDPSLYVATVLGPQP